MGKRKKRFKIRHLILLVIVIFLVVTITKQQLKINKIKGEQAMVEAQIQEALKEQQELKKQIELLKTDSYIEKIARDELGLVKPGEIIYKIGEDK